MKFASFAALAAFSGLGAANYVVEVTCTEPAPTTIYSTVTVTECPHVTLPPPPPPAKTPPPYISTSGGTVTSCDFGVNGYSTVWVYPTGTGTHQATCAVYQNNVFIEVNIVDIEVVIVNGVATTYTSTLTNTVTYTPPPITVTSSNSTMTSSTSTSSSKSSSKISTTSSSSSSSSTLPSGGLPTVTYKRDAPYHIPAPKARRAGEWNA